jgi:hypothetical protein
MNTSNRATLSQRDDRAESAGQEGPEGSPATGLQEPLFVTRRGFLRQGLAQLTVAGIGAYGMSSRGTAAPASIRGQATAEGELLYNGIRLPRVWPPRNMEREGYQPMPVPYLASPPEVIPISVGRQLFVDDFLIAQTTLARNFHRPRKHRGNPIFSPEAELETANGLPVACPKSGGIWWDPSDERFKMWYEAGWLGTAEPRRPARDQSAAPGIAAGLHDGVPRLRCRRSNATIQDVPARAQ